MRCMSLQSAQARFDVRLTPGALLCSMLMALDPSATEEQSSTCTGSFVVAQGQLRSCSFTAQRPGCSLEDLHALLALAHSADASAQRLHEYEALRAQPASAGSMHVFTGAAEQVLASGCCLDKADRVCTHVCMQLMTLADCVRSNVQWCLMSCQDTTRFWCPAGQLLFNGVHAGEQHVHADSAAASR